MLAWTQDTTAALIVIGGTLGATVLRCGAGDAIRTLRLIGAGVRGGIDTAAMRGGLAPQVRQFNLDGLVRARPLPTGDAAIDAALAVLVAQRSVAAMRAAHDEARGVRLAAAGAAVRTLAQAAELAPVAGLAATLVALGRLPAGIAQGAAMDAIGLAVHATLIGLVMAHLVLVPLAAWVDRRALAAEAARDGVVAWLGAQLAHAAPGAAPARIPAPRTAPVETIDLPGHPPRAPRIVAAPSGGDAAPPAPLPPGSAAGAGPHAGAGGGPDALAVAPAPVPPGAIAGDAPGAWPAPPAAAPPPRRARPDRPPPRAAAVEPVAAPGMADAASPHLQAPRGAAPEPVAPPRLGGDRAGRPDAAPPAMPSADAPRGPRGEAADWPRATTANPPDRSGAAAGRGGEAAAWLAPYLASPRASAPAHAAGGAA